MEEGAARPSAATPEGVSAPAVSTRVLTIPNILSLVRLSTVPVFVWLFLSGRENAAVVLYAAGASTDWLDGYIARRTGAITELGKLLDPLADRIFIVALCVALVARETMPWWLAAAIVGRDLLVLSAFPLLDRRGVRRIPVSFVGKTATASLLIGLTWLAVSETTLPLREQADEIGLAFTWFGAGLYWIAGALYAREAIVRSRSVASGDPVV